ncbi:MAG: ATP-binding protein, partial [Armatimonadetes bacterium]|nr:ATP-binding protein [Armatimonadota bacterium]
IDAGLHHTVMQPYLGALRSESRSWGAQVFAATHNDEFLTHLVEAFADEPDAVAAFRLVVKEGRHLVTRIPYEGLKTSRELGWEVR